MERLVSIVVGLATGYLIGSILLVFLCVWYLYASGEIKTVPQLFEDVYGVIEPVYEANENLFTLAFGVGIVLGVVSSLSLINIKTTSNKNEKSY